MRNRKMKKGNRITERALYASLLSMVMCCVMLFETTYAWFSQKITSDVAVIKTGKMSAELVVPDGENSYVKAGTTNLIFKEYDVTEKKVGSATLFEPGKSYCLPEIRVQNTGDIDLKYTVEVNITGAATAVISDAAVETAAEGENADESTQTVNLCDVISFTAFVGGDTSNPIALTGDENSENSDSNVSNTITGILKAAAEGEVSVSEPIVILATMNPNAGSDYQNLKLSGIQIIVNATQLIATEENIENNPENSTEQAGTAE